MIEAEAESKHSPSPDFKPGPVTEQKPKSAT